jgi:hypothetical protein
LLVSYDSIRLTSTRPPLGPACRWDGLEQLCVLVDMKQLSVRVSALKTHILMQKMLVDFFNENTSVVSGTTRKTRRLLQSRTAATALLCSAAADTALTAAAHPELSRAGHLAKHYTALQANTLQGLDEVREVEERLAAAKKHNMDKLVAKQLAALGIRSTPVQTPARVKLERSVQVFDAVIPLPTHQGDLLGGAGAPRRALHRGERLHAVPHLRLGARGRGGAGCGGGGAGCAEQTARDARRLCHLHLRQYEKKRAKAQQLEADLVSGEGVLYRDFVKDHDETGAKVCSLQLCCWSGRCWAARGCWPTSRASQTRSRATRGSRPTCSTSTSLRATSSTRGCWTT